MRVAYLGPQGTFSEEAAHRWIAWQMGKGEPVPQSGIPQIFSCLKQGDADFGVVPVENSIEGTVNIALDSITESEELHIVGEVVLKIEQNLVMYREFSPSVLEGLTCVYSHPQAFAQCGKFLRESLPQCELRQTGSTAEAAQMVAALREANVAGICSSFASSKYDLNIIAAGIHEFPNNETRFVVIGRQPFEQRETRGEGKTSLVFSLAVDRPGGLYIVLKDFAENNINLTKIESRPLKQELGRYLFYLDCEGWAWDPVLSRVIRGLKEKTSFYRVLGTYPKARGDGHEGKP